MPVVAVYLLFGVAATVAVTPVDVLEVEVVEVDDGTAMVEGTEEVDAEDDGADEDGTEEDGTGTEDEKDEEEDITADEDVVLNVGAW